MMREKEVDGDGNLGGGERTMGRDDSESVREMQLSIAASSSVFPGFRFSPTDDELISYYLKKKLQGCDNCVDIIPEVDFCRHEPWDLPGLSIIRSDNEWFFFSARGKKYPNGSQSKRATQSGYWKATGKERNVKSGAVTIGTKRTLVFHTGRAPKGERTEWIMHEYCMSDTCQEALVVCRLRRNGDFRVNESPRGSSDHRISPAADNDHDHSATNECANNTQIDGDGFDDENAIKSCSMESKSSYRSHSIEQNDSESVSDQQLIDDFPDGFSTPYKEGDNEDDCFADIMKDDIIKLDESGSHSFMIHGVLTGTKCTEILPTETMSAQGTAVRRIRLGQQNTDLTKHEPPSSCGDHNNNPTSDKKVPGCVLSLLAGNANCLSKFHPMYLVFLLLLIMLVAWKGNYMDARQHMGNGMEASRWQLSYWLRKADDNI
ncbi:putative transcription factor NAM family [Helianthus annuus]|uniref:Putative NAC domain-containing protein n=1 Tax=Helianthus annuus TaxID=4232 RepID=A0A251SW19_HELAN|nr:NAC domain-containing protein 40 isoform X2 [Helianthus annuus]KAF5775118.1 putative transcription factor NAM family [Helianthus annuus]KAJ0478314.1 putative transcription factor NAM family [Helianthus annuus]KAJ0483028.1 putative transcription factor NAM family [Helianthus annuus]KAJ0499197.1 putative transcription factor NAM family [Helianthus annuus]KAJ0665214.1 putative transcription factor NAM family [Helianthus annuus]